MQLLGCLHGKQVTNSAPCLCLMSRRWGQQSASSALSQEFSVRQKILWQQAQCKQLASWLPEVG